MAFLTIAFLSGCSTAHTINRVFFPDASINGHPAHFALDTGAAMTLITASEARTTDLQTVFWAAGSEDPRKHVSFALSEPAHVTIGNNSFTSQLVIGNTPGDVNLDSAHGVILAGLVGWPEIWNNILVFDGVHRKIISASTLPLEAARWLKFPIRHTLQLTLATPLPNGKSGTILVDTGSYIGVGLPTEQWKAWRNAHPNAPTASLAYYTPGVGQVIVTEAWADEIKLGALTLTDVPVHEANSSEMSVDPDNFAGSIGLYAISRMNFVLDARHGVAYLNPLPPPGPYYSAFNRPGIVDDAVDSPNGGDWTIEGPFKFDVDDLNQFSSDMVMDSGNRKFSAGDIPGALADMTRAIEIDPKNFSAILRRGQVREFENDFPAAIDDYNRAVEAIPPREGSYQRQVLLGRINDLKDDTSAAIVNYTNAITLDPKSADAYYLRGVDLQARGNLVDALADYDQAAQVASDNFTVPQLYREVLRRWIGAPSGNLSDVITTWKESWSKNAARYLSGAMSEAAFLAEADKDAHDRVVQCQTYYIVGINHLLKQDLAGARAFWQKCLSTNLKSLPEYRFAAAGLAQLDAIQQK